MLQADRDTLYNLYLQTMIPTTVINQWQNGKMFEFSIDSIPESRRKDYYYEILTSRHYAKELRIYDLEKPMRERLCSFLAQRLSAYVFKKT